MFSVRFVLLFGLMAVQAMSQLTLTCPSAMFIRPCTCKTPYTGRQVLCRRLTDYTPIRRALNLFDNYPIDTFLWEKIVLEDYLPPDFFRGFKVKWFRSWNSKFAFEPGRLPFEGQEDSLNRLHLVQSEVNITNFPLNHLRELREIDFHGLNLSEVKAEWVAQWPVELMILRLEECHIKKLAPKVFQRLVYLKVLSLSHNEISKLDRTMLPEEMDYLHTLELTNNQLTDLEPGFFSRMPSLRRISLYQNHLTQLRWITWFPVWDGLELLMLNDNPIYCNSSIKWICNLRVPTILEGTCAGPSSLKGMSLSALTENIID